MRNETVFVLPIGMACVLKCFCGWFELKHLAIYGSNQNSVSMHFYGLSVRKYLSLTPAIRSSILSYPTPGYAQSRVTTKEHMHNMRREVSFSTVRTCCQFLGSLSNQERGWRMKIARRTIAGFGVESAKNGFHLCCFFSQQLLFVHDHSQKEHQNKYPNHRSNAFYPTAIL